MTRGRPTPLPGCSGRTKPRSSIGAGSAALGSARARRQDFVRSGHGMGTADELCAHRDLAAVLIHRARKLYSGDSIGGPEAPGPPCGPGRSPEERLAQARHRTDAHRCSWHASHAFRPARACACSPGVGCRLLRATRPKQPMHHTASDASRTWHANTGRRANALHLIPNRAQGLSWVRHRTDTTLVFDPDSPRDVNAFDRNASMLRPKCNRHSQGACRTWGASAAN